MRYIIFLALLSASILSRGQDLSVFEKRVYKNANGDELQYRILYPKNYDKTAKYPLVIFLHGAGERGNDNEAQLTHGAKLFLKEDNREKFPAIIIFPQCPKEGFWSSVEIDRSKTPLEFTFDYKRPMTRPLMLVQELVKKVSSEEAVDQSRVYVAGLSMGGMGTFELVYHSPGVFAAAMPICGGGDAKHYDRRNTKTPFWVFHGDKDPVVDVKYSREMVDRLKQLKAKIQYTEYPGVEHNSWDNAFAEPTFLSWMFTQKK